MWKIAAVQMDCRLGDPAHNRAAVRTEVRKAAAAGARLAVFPECVVTGYCFSSREEAWPFAEVVPGPTTDLLAGDCARLGIWAVAGLLERGPSGELFNACVLVGPNGWGATYRKAHLPFLGVDRFTTPGDQPFAVHDLGGLRVGMNICYDGSFPETARALALLGADLVVLPTNWPAGARLTMQLLPQARALENRVYYAAVDRIGEERGFRFIGNSRLVGCDGQLLATAGEDTAEILYAEIDPEKARAKRVVILPGAHEVDRIKDRRPDLYGPLTEPKRDE